MDSGFIRQVGPPAEVYRQPASRFVADFMGETNLIEGSVIGRENGHVQVETPLRTFSATAHGWKPDIGHKVLVSIRPEAWRLGTDANATNAVNGRIRERMYLGEMAQYRFAANTELLKIYELNPRFVFTNSHDDLFASALPEDVVALPLG
jgi:iron(III) transport system ATP-binding protein